jgi:uncharacterized DUF497 family protein
MRYDFDWDPKKAATNTRTHRISFERASSIFRDPHLLSIPDKEHSENEERWITIGIDGNGSVLVLVHTFKKVSQTSIRIRMISARKATKHEIETYEDGI